MTEMLKTLAGLLAGSAAAYGLIWLNHVRKMRKIDRDVAEQRRQAMVEWDQRVQEITSCDLNYSGHVKHLAGTCKPHGHRGWQIDRPCGCGHLDHPRMGRVEYLCAEHSEDA